MRNATLQSIFPCVCVKNVSRIFSVTSRAFYIPFILQESVQKNKTIAKMFKKNITKIKNKLNLNKKNTKKKKLNLNKKKKWVFCMIYLCIYASNYKLQPPPPGPSTNVVRLPYLVIWMDYGRTDGQNNCRKALFRGY